MSDKTKNVQLIVRQSLSGKPGMDDLLRLLADEYGLDAYTARHRLTGSGKALFGSGTRETTGQMARLLREHGFECWVVQRTGNIAPPHRLPDLAVHPEGL